MKSKITQSDWFLLKGSSYDYMTNWSSSLDPENKMGIYEILKNLKQDIDKYMKNKSDIENRHREVPIPFQINSKYLDSGAKMLELCFEEYNMCELCC